MSKLTKLDRINGMFYGLAIGDSIGMPLEFFNTTPKFSFSPYINTVPFDINFQFASIHVDAPTVSDDTEMTLALLKSLLNSDMKYSSENSVKEYLIFGNTSKMLGRNTRKLFKGVTTIKGYQNRFSKLTDEEKENMQSNGSLMRASPLALLTENECIKTDCYLTNPNSINYFANIIFIHILRHLLNGGEKADCIDIATNIAMRDDCPDEIMEAVKDSMKKDVCRSLNGKLKGWVVSSLYIALYSFWTFEKYEDAVNFIINIKGSDTDTNASITGALFGAWKGKKTLEQEEYTSKNVEILENKLREIDELIEYVAEWNREGENVEMEIEFID
jgi:ADP-ribosyl-[dinitrogen reductase] hydrolase